MLRLYLLFVFGGLALIAPAEAQDGIIGRGIVTFECRRPDCVMLVNGTYETMLQANASLAARIVDLEAEVAKLKEIKGCARLTVIPKPMAWKGA